MLKSGLILFLFLSIGSLHSKELLTFLHFNDVYDLQVRPTQPKAGAAYFKTMLDRYRTEDTITFFSGDVFAPSQLSREYNGQNMVLPLNHFRIDLATFGNHQFDYSVERITQLVNKNNFTWLASNIRNKKTGKLFLEGQQYKVLTSRGYRIGVFSLIQQQIGDLVLPVYNDLFNFEDTAKTSRRIISRLKNQQNCDLIIALTHMAPNKNRKLANEVDGIDIILGGHSHLKVHEKVKNTINIESGSDFMHFSKVQVEMKSNLKDTITLKQVFLKRDVKGYEKNFYFETDTFEVILTLVQINHSLAEISPDPIIDEHVKRLSAQFKQKLQKVALFTKHPIDFRDEAIRKSQSPYLNFLAETYRLVSKADCAIINSGGFRENRYVGSGAITFSTFLNFIKDDIVVKSIKGSDLYLLLENSFSAYPQIHGKYGQLANIQLIWDSSKAPFSRIDYGTIKVNGQNIEDQKIYKVAFRGFCAQGSDGYNQAKAAPTPENSVPIPKSQIMAQLLDPNSHIYRLGNLRNFINVVHSEGNEYVELTLDKNYRANKVKDSAIKKQQQL